MDPSSKDFWVPTEPGASTRMSRLCGLTSLFLLIPHIVLGAVIFQHPDDLPSANYDFIVVGGGTAGGVIAARLGENKKFKVLVIEAGISNEDVFETKVPGLSSELRGTRVDWNYTLVPQEGLGGQRIPYSRAKMLGGCSSHNQVVYTRGSRDDYDRWAAVTGNAGLSWDNIQPYISKTENFSSKNKEHLDEKGHFDPSIHSKKGKISVSATYTDHPFNDLVLKTTNQLSQEFPFKLDTNDGKPIGVGWGQATIGDGVRSSSATGYLTPTKANVHILLNTLVTRVIPTNGSTPYDFRIVEFATSAQEIRRNLTAKNEVILSGGFVNTPQVLLNSGIGPRAELEALGITTLIDNPSVGKNVSDHPATLATFETNGIPTTDYDRTTALAQWNKSHTGPLSRAQHLNLFVWVRLPDDAEPFKSGAKDPSSGTNSPHIEFIPESVSTQNIFAPTQPTQTARVQVFIANLNPISRGSITLASSDPFTYPNIDMGFLKDPMDVAIIREGIKSARRFFSAPVWNGKVLGLANPPANSTDSDLETYIRAVMFPFFHGIGSASMSPRGSQWGVVDPDFSVKGAKGLRVVDASVMPLLPAAHTQVPVYAIAEQASDVIKSLWK